MLCTCQHSGWYELAVGVCDPKHTVLSTVAVLPKQRHGAALEVVTSRMRLIASQVPDPIRIVGLCTSLANAKDLGEWIGASSHSLFNFPPGATLHAMSQEAPDASRHVLSSQRLCCVSGLHSMESWHGQ